MQIALGAGLGHRPRRAPGAGRCGGIAVTVGIFGGLMNKLLGMHAGVQFMAYYTAALFIPKLLA